MFKEDGNAEFDPADVSGSDSDYIQKKMLRMWTNLEHQGLGREKCDVAVLVVVARGVDMKHQVPLKSR